MFRNVHQKGLNCTSSGAIRADWFGLVLSLSSTSVLANDLNKGETGWEGKWTGDCSTAVTFTNKTGVDITDLEFTFVGSDEATSGYEITITEVGNVGDKWDLDDDKDGELEAGEDDDIQDQVDGSPPPASTARLEAKDHSDGGIAPNSNFTVVLCKTNPDPDEGFVDRPITIRASTSAVSSRGNDAWVAKVGAGGWKEVNVLSLSTSGHPNTLAYFAGEETDTDAAFTTLFFQTSDSNVSVEEVIAIPPATYKPGTGQLTFGSPLAPGTPLSVTFVLDVTEPAPESAIIQISTSPLAMVIPTMSEWGLAVSTLTLLIGATVVIRRRCPQSTMDT